MMAMLALQGCALCWDGCGRVTRTGNSTSLVEFLYADGVPPRTDTVPELRIPLRVGLAFLPSLRDYGTTTLDPAQKQQLLERIRQRFQTRQFVSEISIIPDYYLSAAKGFGGLAGVQRLEKLDLIALVSYDQITRRNDNPLSLGYLTIVGAYILPGTNRETTTLVDLAVVDPQTRSLVLRSAGTSEGRGLTTQANAAFSVRNASVKGFDTATAELIENFDVALTKFEADVRAGKANVRVVRRNGGAGAFGGLDAAALALLLVAALWRSRARMSR
jgi:rhombotail lipoprotein